jgi:PPIC-type PPIASE domain.
MKKMAAAVCAAALAVSMTGCADTSWAVKYKSVTLPIGVYNYFLLSSADSVTNMAASNSSASSDVWSQTVSGTGAVTWAMNTALDSCKQMAIIEQLCADKKIKIADSDKTNVANTTSSEYDAYSGLFSKNGISETSMERIQDISYLDQSLFNAYDKAGTLPVTASGITDYYAKNYVHVKQIFVAKEDLSQSTPVAYTGAKLTAQTNKANAAYKAAKADPQNFDKYVKQYNEDPGMKSNPDGYYFSKDTAASQSFDTNFTNLAFSLKDGAVGMAQSDMGYFIEYRVKLEPAKISASDKQAVQQTLKANKFSDMIKALVKKATFTLNNAALDKYSPKKIDLTAS